jgi:hypothetical protein
MAVELGIPRDQGIIARLYQASVEVLTVTVKRSRQHKDALRGAKLASARRALQSLVIWGEDHNVASGALDAILQKSRRLQYATLLLLRNIAIILIKGMSRLAILQIKPT